MPTAVLAFEPRRSDLPLQVAFPILLANLTGELLGGSAAPTEAVAPGTRSSCPIPAGATALTRHPTRRHDRRARRPATDGRRVGHVRQTDLLGVYTVDARSPTRPRPPGRPARPAGAPPASGRRHRRRGASPGVVRRRPIDPTRRCGSPWTCSTSTSRHRARLGRRARGAGPWRAGVTGPAVRRRPAPVGTAGIGPGAAERPTDPRRAVGPDRPARPRRACASSGSSTTVTRSSGCGAASPAPARARRGRTAQPDGHPVRRAARAAAADPGAAPDVRAAPRRAPADGRGPAARGARRPDAPAGGARPRARRVPARPAGRSAGDGLRRRPVRFGRQRRPRGRARVPARDPRGDAGGRRRRASSRSARTRSSSACRRSSREIDRLASTPVKAATDIGAALRLAAALFPDDAQKRIVLLSDGNDTTGARPARGRARGRARHPDRDAGHRPRRPRRGARRAPDDAVHRPPRRVDPGRSPRSARPSPSRPRSGCSPTASWSRPSRVELAAGVDPGRPSTSSRPRPGSTPSASSSRPRATRSARTTAPTRTRSSRASRGRWSSPATRSSPRSWSRRSRRSASRSTRSSRRRSRPTSPSLADLRQHRPGRRPAGAPVTTASWPRSRSSSATSGKGLVMVGGPKSYGAGGYKKTPLEETLPVDMGVRDRQKQPDIALVVVIDKSGSMDACHCNTFDGGTGGGAGIEGVRKVDIGKEAILRAAAALTARDELGVVAFDEPAHWVVKTQPLGGIGDLAGPDRRHPAARPDEHLRRPRAGGRVARGRGGDPPPHHPADRRLVALGRVRRDHRADEGGRDHALDGRRRRRLEPVPREPRQGRRRPVLRRGEPVEHPGHLPQGDAAGRRPADHRGGVLPDPDLVVADPARRSRRAASRSSSATTARRSSPRRRSCSSRRATIRSSPSGSTASGRSVAWTSDSTGRWASDWVGWHGFTRFFSQLVSWTFPGEETDGIEASFETVGGQTTLHVESVEADGSPRDFYATSAVVVGPGPRAGERRARPGRAGRLRGAARRDRPGRLRRPRHPDAARRARRWGGRSGWSPRPPPSTGCSARTSRSCRRCAPRPAGPRSSTADGPVDATT